MCCLMVLMIPAQSQAFLGLSCDILSFGPFSLGIDIPLKSAVALIGVGLVAGAVISFFSRGSGSGYSYAASHSKPLTRHVKVTINPKDPYKGEALKTILYHHQMLDDNQYVPLDGKAYLEVQDETGKMLFRNSDFDDFFNGRKSVPSKAFQNM